MRIAFFDRESPELTPQKKGKLFEALVQRIGAQAGYTDLTLRAKHSSLEYDVEGRSILHNAPLVGEAKAHDASIPGQVLSAFVGKLLPLTAKGRIAGLFVSTSPFTAEAVDYLDSTRGTLDGLGIAFTTLVGSEIPDFFATHAAYVTDATLKSRVAELFELELLDTWLVCGVAGDFLVAACGPDNVAAATSFAAFKPNGSELALTVELVERLKAQHPDLSGLNYVSSGSPLTAEAVRVERLPSVAAGAGPLDYRFPSPPEFFIGRAEPLQEISGWFAEVGAGSTATRTIQVLSRSGVGKSSLLLKIPSAIEGPAVTIDGRSVRTASDVRLVVTEVVGRINELLDEDVAIAEPRSLDGVTAALEAVGQVLAARGEVLAAQIDQFESALRIPAVFDGILNLVETTTSRQLPIVWVFARKSDVAVTYDEGLDVDLGRLNELSYAARLDDFDPEESRTMFGQLASALGEPVSSELANAISTFSAGFPWLHKRLCAHVVTMKELGVTQRDLVQAGLRAEDLFEDDLAGLTEQDRALLVRVASHLPATASELAAYLEAEITPGRLTEKLNQFLGTKLLRLAGDIYDAYNDVFKTYLVTGQIPFEARYVYRVQPVAATALLRRIQELGPLALSDFQAKIGGSRVANLNKLRDLRLLGLINPKRGRVELALETQEALERASLGELLRRRLRANGLVVRALDLVAARDQLSLNDLQSELRREMPEVEVADATWTHYARTLASWLHFASLVQLEGDVVATRDVPVDEVLQGRAFTRGAFAPDTFVPSARPDKLVAFLGLFAEASEIPRSGIKALCRDTEVPGLIKDAVALGLADIQADRITLGPQGLILKGAGRAVIVRDLAQLALTKPNMEAMVAATGLGVVSEPQQREIMGRFGSAQWADATWKWRLGVLRSWLVATGLVTSTRSGLTAME